jgi:short-subunit dehydrogenase
MTAASALITGASAGLGSEFARQLAAGGKSLILVARREEPMRKLAEQLRQENPVEVDIIVKDLSKPAAPAELYKAVRELDREVDYLINNAGSGGRDLLREMDLQEAHDYVELMMTSIVALCHLFIPAMRERGFGRVLNVASVAGLVATPGDYSYGPTKKYVIAFSRGLSTALRRDGINVTALCPGFTHTDFHSSEKLARKKESLPGFLWYDANVVVREGLGALEKGRTVCVSGRLYRWLVPLLRSPLGRLILPG